MLQKFFSTLRNWAIHYPFNSMELFVGSCSSMISNWLRCIQNEWLLITCGACLEVVLVFEWWATYFGSMRARLNLAPLGMPKWTNIRCSLSKHPHYLQACAKNLLNMEDAPLNPKPWPKVQFDYTALSLCENSENKIAYSQWVRNIRTKLLTP